MYLTKNRLLKWGLCLNVIYLFLHFLFLPDGFTIINISITSLLLLSWTSICYICITRVELLTQISNRNKNFLYLLFFWCFVTFIRGFTFTLQDWVTNLGNVFMGPAWLVPITLIIGLKIENWNLVFKVLTIGFWMTTIALLYLPFTYVNEEWIWLLRPINFIFLTVFYYYRTSKKIYFILPILAFIIISYMGGRRLEFLYLIITFLFLFIDKIAQIKIKKILIKYILLCFVFLSTIIFFFGYKYVSATISFFIEFQDTRTFLFNDFFADMSLTDQIFGKGSIGTYYSEFINHTREYTIKVLKKSWWGDVPVRITIEVGYLQMILKGGFIMFLLQFYFYVRSSYLAIFKSKNKFIKRLGFYILIISIISLIEFRPAFTPTFIVLWMAIGTVLKKEYRDMDNDEIKEKIKLLK